MFKTIKHYIGVGVHFIKLSICEMMEYPMNLFGWLIGNPLNFFLSLATIKFVVAEFETLNGWEFNELAFLYGIAIMSHGLSIILFIQTWYMGSLMLHGEFDRFMLRPLSVLFQFLFLRFNLIGVTDLIPGTIIFIYGCTQVHFQWTLHNTLAIIGVLIGATLIRGALFLFTGSTAFWTKSNSEFIGLDLAILEKTTIYPLSMYPQAIQHLFTFIVPLGFVSFYPASDILGKPNMFFNGVIWITLLVGLFVFWLATRLFNSGLKRYESCGS